MKGDVIPEGNHVVRYCKPRYVVRRSKLPEIDAFRLDRARGEKSLSVNWIECFDSSVLLDTRDQREAAIVWVRDVMHYDLHSNGAFAFFRVDEIKRAVEVAGGTDPYLESDPSPAQPATDNRSARGPDPSHALVLGIPEDDYAVGVQLRAIATLDPDLRLFPGITSSTG